MFNEEGNACNTFVRADGCTQCELVSNTEFNHNFCLFTRKLHRAPLMSSREMCGECFVDTLCPGSCLSGYLQAALPYWWRLLGSMQPEMKTCRHYSELVNCTRALQFSGLKTSFNLYFNLKHWTSAKNKIKHSYPPLCGGTDWVVFHTEGI